MLQPQIQWKTSKIVFQGNEMSGEAILYNPSTLRTNFPRIRACSYSKHTPSPLLLESSSLMWMLDDPSESVSSKASSARINAVQLILSCFRCMLNLHSLQIGKRVCKMDRPPFLSKTFVMRTVLSLKGRKLDPSASF